jgi:hypothetical protein
VPADRARPMPPAYLRGRHGTSTLCATGSRGRRRRWRRRSRCRCRRCRWHRRSGPRCPGVAGDGAGGAAAVEAARVAVVAELARCWMPLPHTGRRRRSRRTARPAPSGSRLFMHFRSRLARAMHASQGTPTTGTAAGHRVDELARAAAVDRVRASTSRSLLRAARHRLAVGPRRRRAGRRAWSASSRTTSAARPSSRWQDDLIVERGRSRRPRRSAGRLLVVRRRATSARIASTCCPDRSRRARPR